MYTVYGLHIGDYNIKYVGSTKQTLTERLRAHRSKFKNRDIKIEPLIQNIRSKTEALIKEAFMVQYFDTFRHGWNKTVDGDFHGQRTEEVCDRIHDMKKNYEFDKEELFEYWETLPRSISLNQRAEMVNEEFNCNWKDPYHSMRHILDRDDIHEEQHTLSTKAKYKKYNHSESEIIEYFNSLDSMASFSKRARETSEHFDIGWGNPHASMKYMLKFYENRD